MEPKLKLALTAGGAVGALALAAWIGFSSMGGGRTLRSSDSAAQAADQTGGPTGGPGGNPGGLPGDHPDGGEHAGETTFTFGADGQPAPAWVTAQHERALAYQEPFAFPDRGEGKTSFVSSVEDLAIRAENDSELTSVGLGSRRGLIATYRAFMEPLIAGDEEAFKRAIESMNPEHPGLAGQLYDRAAAYLDGARIALDAARIRSLGEDETGDASMGLPDIPGVDLRARAASIPMMIERHRFDDDNGGSVDYREMKLPLSLLFPDASDASRDGARTVEVWAPAKLGTARGDRADIAPTLRLVHDEGSGRWVPVSFTLALVSDESVKKLEQYMASLRKAASERKEATP